MNRYQVSTCEKCNEINATCRSCQYHEDAAEKRAREFFEQYDHRTNTDTYHYVINTSDGIRALARLFRDAHIENLRLLKIEEAAKGLANYPCHCHVCWTSRGRHDPNGCTYEDVTDSGLRSALKGSDNDLFKK